MSQKSETYLIISQIYIFQSPIENAIHKFGDHPSIVAIKRYTEAVDSLFCFETVTQDKNAEPITNLDTKETVHFRDIPTKLVEKFVCLFSKHSTASINKCIRRGIDVNSFQKPKFVHFYEKKEEQKSQIIDPLESFRIFQKSMKNNYMN